MNIADRIQTLRKSRGISQEELADKIGVSRQAVSKWESDQCCPDISLLPLLADIFGITIDELLMAEQLDEKLLLEKYEAKAEQNQHYAFQNPFFHALSPSISFPIEKQWQPSGTTAFVAFRYGKRHYNGCPTTSRLRCI